MPTYTIRDEGDSFTFEAINEREAKAIAREWLENGAADLDVESTTWIHGHLTTEGEYGSLRVTATIQPPVPKCGAEDGDAHDWQSPYELLGGLRENPGVWGHGGGVIVNEVCMRCGCKRTTDTWAQDRETGEQGLTSVTYEEGAFEV